MFDYRRIMMSENTDLTFEEILNILKIYLLNLKEPERSALVYRFVFDLGALKTALNLQKHIRADVPITEIYNVSYRPDDPDGHLDVFYSPEKVEQTPDKVLPTIVWVHGGGWISGTKRQVANYLKILASYGYTVVGVDYSIAPEYQYPLPLIQVNDALNYLIKPENAERLHIDTSKLVLAGDSAGSQIAAQIATIITNEEYKNKLNNLISQNQPLLPNILPELKSDQLKGVVLTCGAYNIDLLNTEDNPLPDKPIDGQDIQKFVPTAMWSYSGTWDVVNDELFQTISVVKYVDDKFPPSFITAGDQDPLLPHSLELYEKLKGLGVKTDTLFYEVIANSYPPKPGLNHEYQFDLDDAERYGQKSLDRITAFLQNVFT